MNSIRQMGYILLTVPAADLKPLSLLEKTGKGEAKSLHAGVEDLFKVEDVAVPPVSTDIPLPDHISHTENLDLKLEANFSFFSAITRFFSDDAKTSFNASRDSTVQLHLSSPVKNTVNILKLNAFLQHAALQDGMTNYQERIEDGELFIVTEIIKAKKFSLQDASKKETGAEAGVPLKNIVEIGVDVEKKNDKALAMEYDGEAELTIGIKAHQILYRKGKFTLESTDKIEVMREDAFASEQLQADENILSLENYE